MRREFFFGTVFAACMAVGLGAQSTTSQSQSTSNPQSTATSTQSDQSNRSSSRADRNDSQHTVTLAGCISNGNSMGTTGTTGSSASSYAASNNFTLSDVEMVGRNKPTAGNTGINSGAQGQPNGSSITGTGAATSGSAGSTGAGTQYGTMTGSSANSGNSALGNSANSSSTSQQSVAGTSGTAATGLTLEGKNLSKYAGKRVQVKGTIDNAGDWSSTSGMAPTSGTLHVTSVKSLGGTCASGR